MIADPEDRRKAASAYIESVGGKLHGFWYAFGSHDGYNLWEAPDHVSMAVKTGLALAGRPPLEPAELPGAPSGSVFRMPATNTFLLKVSYWFSS